MKKLSFLIFSFLGGLSLAQLSELGINVGTNHTLQSHTILQIDTIDKGVLFPRLDTSEINNLSVYTSELPDGLLIFNIATKCFQYWSKNKTGEVDQWKSLCSKGNASTTPVANNPAKSS